MNIALWVVQGLLAVVFLVSGGMKATTPREKLTEKLPVLGKFSTPTIRFIGVSEILGSLALILPGVTGIAVKLTPIAAVGLSIIMVPAAYFHYQRKESKDTVTNVVLLVLTVLIAWARFGKYSF